MHDWLTDKISSSQKFDFSGPEKVLVDAIFDKISASDLNSGRYLAAAFDLLMTAEYYKSVTIKGWHYCPDGKPKMYYSFLNACPCCRLQQRFVFTLGNKPQSGAIGKSSTLILALLLNEYFSKTGSNVEIRKSMEPIDLLLVDEVNKQVFAAEVKSAPLTILPLFAESDEMTMMEEGDIVKVKAHEVTSNPHFSSLPTSIGSPTFKNGDWQFAYFNMEGSKHDKHWPYIAIAKLVETTDFWKQYVNYWVEAYATCKYRKRENPIYWFSNACGSPQAVTGNWPDRRSGVARRASPTAKPAWGWTVPTTSKKEFTKF
ncbi:MAG: hypothetical protein KIS77_21425 [Saprospiraceae bacterium]|nr:hypothetical protein [Saprospiraceae bacterium]